MRTSAHIRRPDLSGCEQVCGRGEEAGAWEDGIMMHSPSIAPVQVRGRVGEEGRRAGSTHGRARRASGREGGRAGGGMGTGRAAERTRIRHPIAATACPFAGRARRHAGAPPAPPGRAEGPRVARALQFHPSCIRRPLAPPQYAPPNANTPCRIQYRARRAGVRLGEREAGHGGPGTVARPHPGTGSGTAVRPMAAPPPGRARAAEGEGGAAPGGPPPSVPLGRAMRPRTGSRSRREGPARPHHRARAPARRARSS